MRSVAGVPDSGTFARTVACGTLPLACRLHIVAAEPAALEHVPARSVGAPRALHVAAPAILVMAVGLFPVELGVVSRVLAAQRAFDHGDGFGREGCRGIVDCGLGMEMACGPGACVVLKLLCVGERDYACVLGECDGKVSLVVGAVESG